MVILMIKEQGETLQMSGYLHHSAFKVTIKSSAFVNGKGWKIMKCLLVDHIWFKLKLNIY